MMKKQIKKFLSVVLTAAMVITGFAFTPAVEVETKAASTGFSSVGGWMESIYAQLDGVSDSQVTAVSYSGEMNGSLTGDDLTYLVRDNGNGVRIDIPGLKAGTYTLTVETTQGDFTKSGLVVTNYDRSGYAHFNYTAGVGAYNDDGTLKDNAVVLYVTDDNKNTVTLSYGGVTVTGIGNILNSVGEDVGGGVTSNGGTPNTNQGIIKKLADAGIPLVVRFVGIVSDSGLYERGTFNPNNSLIDGLTVYNTTGNGGTAGDNGHMARIRSGKDITLEGIGTDATVDGWGFHFMCATTDKDTGRGTSFEVRNLTFINTPEDAVGMEGTQGTLKDDGTVENASSATADILGSVERCWVHNNEFYCPSISPAAESDKSEGDGSVDFKRGQYFTCSYNYFEGCHKTNLVGSSDTSLQFNLTYHHNWFDHSDSRHPRVRGDQVHVYNNFYDGNSKYGIGSCTGSSIYVEKNVFRNCLHPVLISRQGTDALGDGTFSGEDGGVIKMYDNAVYGGI
ncbi:MAG: polysaccharide lyase, partial [Lachnospiraceae bacterium]